MFTFSILIINFGEMFPVHTNLEHDYCYLILHITLQYNKYNIKHTSKKVDKYKFNNQKYQIANCKLIVNSTENVIRIN